MSNGLNQERERLTQAELLRLLTRKVSAVEMVDVYHHHETAQHNRVLYAVLIPSTRIEEALATPSWGESPGFGHPGACQYSGENDEKCVEYLRFGVWHNEPLVIDRSFHGIRSDYVELSEEFRLFHRLFHDTKEDQFLKIEDDGTETLVATVELQRVQVRLKELRQFLAVKEMHLAIQFDFRENSSYTLGELGVEKGGADHRDGFVCWGLCYGSFDGMFDGPGGDRRSFSRMLGKRLIQPVSKEESGFWGFAREERKKYEKYTIGVDENGNAVSCTSDPAELADNFGGNKGAPHYLTGVHFNKTVLDKYYQKPGKYTVDDSILRCGSLWSLTMDNHHEGRVCAWLGDLGCELPHSEQLHWRSHNIPPVGGLSETFVRRQLLCQFAESDRPEFVFNEQYDKLQEACADHLGWQLLLPLEEADSHHRKLLRVPSTDDQRDFDELVIGLTKILIDSLNERKLVELIPSSERTAIKGSIARLDAALAACGIDEHEYHVAFLRSLQQLRSTGSAHRKGEKYRKIAAEFGAQDQNLRSIFAAILDHAISTVRFLEEQVRNGRLGQHGGPTRGA